MGIDEPLFLMRRQHITLFANAGNASLRLFIIIIKLFISRLSLAQSHVLHVGNKQFYLIVCNGINRIKELCGMLKIHSHDINKGQVVECLSLSGIITAAQLERAASINSRRIQVSVMIGIRLFVQHVSLFRARMRLTG